LSIIVRKLSLKIKSRFGGSLAEFLIIGPIFLVIILCVIQLGLIINAHQTVKLAAYRSVRSLIVNLNESTFNDALAKAKDSAALNLINISPQASHFDFAKSAFSDSDIALITKLSAVYAIVGLRPEEILKVLERYQFAKNNSVLSIESPKETNDIKRGDEIKVRLDFNFPLSVPVAGRIFYRLFNKEYSVINEELPDNRPWFRDLKIPIINRDKTINTSN